MSQASAKTTGPQRGPKSEWMTVREVAAELQCSTRQVYRWVSAGDLKVTRLGARTLRVHRTDFEAFCALRRTF